jgi:hypothetical protein
MDTLLESLQENGQIAITFAQHLTHETYQLKGHYLRHRPIEPDDLVLVARSREAFSRSVRDQIPDGVPEAYVLGMAIPDPAVAVDVDVREVYVQTPGPGAGSRLYPTPDA